MHTSTFSTIIPPQKKPFTFGEFVAGSYRVWGRRKAIGIIRLAVRAQLIEFRGRQCRSIS
jgi:hypothetical protein